jgi:hypothetical protein
MPASSPANRLIAAAAVPVVLYGVISMSQGALFMPNSLHLKSGATRALAGDRPLGQLNPGFIFEMFRIDEMLFCSYAAPGEAPAGDRGGASGLCCAA